MTRLRAIVLGDKTTHGGVVLQGSHSMTANGKPISLEGDLVACPKCKGNFPIIEGTQKMNSNGKRVALESMKTACGAVLIASQNLVWIDHDPQDYNVEIFGSDDIRSDNVGEQKEIYKVQFHFTNDEGRPYSNKSFIVYLPNEVKKGVTDKDGFTPIFYSDKDGEVKAHLILGRRK